MARIEDYALIGDLHTAALVGRDGSIDWLCLPRFDSDACFAALLGDDGHGRWKIAPAGEIRARSRTYRDGTLILETTFETDEGAIRVVDFMPLREPECRVVRIVEGLRGAVETTSELVLRFDYGDVVPWVRECEGGLTAIAGPVGIALHAPVRHVGEDFRSRARFVVRAGDRLAFAMTYFPSHEAPPAAGDSESELRQAEAWWREWVDRCTYVGPDRDAVRRSLVTLKALTYQPTGAIVAAATTSLPEDLGGAKNWDYRFCWLRDATFSLFSLVNAGYRKEALAWRDWLLRAFAGNPRRLQIMYGLAGERRIDERTVAHLPGYEGASPVRVGNGARTQLQFDVFGEVVDSMHQAHVAGIELDAYAWSMLKVLIDYLEGNWQTPGSGMWEVRESVYQFTEAKVLGWVAADRMVRFAEKFGFDGPVDRWRALRARIHEEVCLKGYDRHQETFTQYYGSREIDASALLIAGVGFLPAGDPRVGGTIRAVERRLVRKGFVHRYEADFRGAGDRTANEGAFLACNFWLADNYMLAGRRADARALFDRVIGVRNDLGLLAEEYDVDAERLVGNYPQAFSHVGLVNSAYNLLGRRAAVHQRAGSTPDSPEESL